MFRKPRTPAKGKKHVPAAHDVETEDGLDQYLKSIEESREAKAAMARLGLVKVRSSESEEAESGDAIEDEGGGAVANDDPADGALIVAGAEPPNSIESEQAKETTRVSEAPEPPSSAGARAPAPEVEAAADAEMGLSLAELSLTGARLPSVDELSPDTHSAPAVEGGDLQSTAELPTPASPLAPAEPPTPATPAAPPPTPATPAAPPPTPATPAAPPLVDPRASSSAKSPGAAPRRTRLAVWPPPKKSAEEVLAEEELDETELTAEIARLRDAHPHW